MCQDTPSPGFVRRRRHENPYALHHRQSPDDLAVDPRDWREFPGPVREPMRPDEPRRLVEGPLRPACGTRSSAGADWNRSRTISFFFTYLSVHS